jgi:tetratricopeptide (TPR) repeat protein
MIFQKNICARVFRTGFRPATLARLAAMAFLVLACGSWNRVLAQSATSIESLDARLKVLENQNLIMKTADDMISRTNIIFTVIAGFFGIFSAYSVYRQHLADKSKEKADAVSRDMARELQEKFRDNISEVNDLMRTMREMFSLSKKLETDLEKVTKVVEEVKASGEQAQEDLHRNVRALNEAAWTVFHKYVRDRQSFKSEVSRGALQNFATDMIALEKMAGARDLFSAFTFFDRALHYFNGSQYKRAEDDLKRAKELAAAEVSAPTAERYGRDAESDVVKEGLTQLLNDCPYHLGIIHYNTGNYAEARKNFEECYSRNPKDFRARMYLPELMFFDLSVPFKQVVAEFDAVEQEFDNAAVNVKASDEWREACGGLFMRRGNAFLPKLPRLPGRTYREEQDATKAKAGYRAALAAFGDDMKNGMPGIFARFSLAQALENKRSIEDKESANDIYREVYERLQPEVTRKTEPILLVLLNYVLAVCSARMTKPSPADSEAYLVKAQEHLRRVPGEVRIFSPLTKLNLAAEDLQKEMSAFQKQSRAAAA